MKENFHSSYAAAKHMYSNTRTWTRPLYYCHLCQYIATFAAYLFFFRLSLANICLELNLRLLNHYSGGCLSTKLLKLTRNKNDNVMQITGRRNVVKAALPGCH